MNDRIRAILRELPEKPGCYLMRDRAGTIIYVGKAVSLRRRVQSYFRGSTLAKATPKLRGLIHSIENLEYLTVRNEAEALLTESRLIKEYKPRFNILMRDDKRYLALRAESTAAVPRFQEVRIVRDDGNEYFGPFPEAGVVHIVKDFVERHYGIRKCRDARPDAETCRHCHNDVVANCSAPCVGKIAPEAYRERFAEACAFLRGERPGVMEALKQEMHQASAEQDFERAARLRDTWMALQDMVRQRARAQARPEMLRAVALDGCQQLADALGLRGVPHVIEGFDISHMGGTLTVASLVASVDGEPAPSRYRRFRIRTAGNDDPASMAEVLTRRYGRLRDEGQPMPDLVLVDGGLAQLRAAREVLAGLGLAEAVQTVGLAKRAEEIVVDRAGVPSVLLPIDSPGLQVLIRLRDEAHRFAITYNRRLRQKRIRESVLDEVQGVGESKKARLLRAFGSVRRLAEADADAVAKAGGVSREIAEEILRVCKGRGSAPEPSA